MFAYQAAGSIGKSARYDPKDVRERPVLTWNQCLSRTERNQQLEAVQQDSGRSGLARSRRTKLRQGAMEDGAPGEIRTPDLMLRRHSLYPAELRARLLRIPQITVFPLSYLGRLQGNRMKDDHPLLRCLTTPLRAPGFTPQLPR